MRRLSSLFVDIKMLCCNINHALFYLIIALGEIFVFVKNENKTKNLYRKQIQIGPCAYFCYIMRKNKGRANACNS